MTWTPSWAIFLFSLSAISFLICIILILYFYFCVSIQSSEFLYIFSYLKKLTKIYYSTTARTFVCLCFFLYISILNLSFSESGSFHYLPISFLFLFRQHKKPKAARNLTKDIFKIVDFTSYQVYFHFSVIVWQFRIYRISTIDLYLSNINIRLLCKFGLSYDLFCFMISKCIHCSNHVMINFLGFSSLVLILRFWINLTVFWLLQTLVKFSNNLQFSVLKHFCLTWAIFVFRNQISTKSRKPSLVY